MRMKQLAVLLAICIDQNLPVLITGAPGIGKSDAVTAAAAAAHADLIISHPVVADPTDVKGLPWPNKDTETATFLPYGDLAKALSATKRTVWFIDDLGQATPAVQAAFMQLFLARQVNGHKLPDHIVFMAATNRRTDRASVQGIIEPVKSRFATIVELEASINDWSEWAISRNLPPEPIAFLRFRPELLHDFKATADMTNSPCPRTWAYVGRLMAAQLPATLEFEVYKGAVGEGAATELMSFIKTYRDLPNLDQILVNPDGAVIPSEPSALFAVATGLATKANVHTADRVFRYAERMMDAGHGEHGVLLVRDALKRDDTIQHTAGYLRLAVGPVGQAIAGIAA